MRKGGQCIYPTDGSDPTLICRKCADGYGINNNKYVHFVQVCHHLTNDSGKKIIIMLMKIATLILLIDITWVVLVVFHSAALSADPVTTSCLSNQYLKIPADFPNVQTVALEQMLVLVQILIKISPCF